MSRKKRSQPRDVILEAQAAAYLYSHGNDQAHVMDVLGVSQAEVSRLLSMARREGWLQTHCVLPDDAKSSVEQLVFAGTNELRARLDREAKSHAGTAVRGLRIYHSGSVATDPAGWNQRLLQFGRHTPIRLQELLPRMQLVGVTWGKAIAALVDGFRQLRPHKPAQPSSVQVIPLTGEPLTYPDPETSSSTLAHRLNDILNGPTLPGHSLAAVPAFIPAKFPRSSHKAIRQFIAEIAGYRVIFESVDGEGRPHQPLVEQVDTIITGVGTVSAEITGRLLEDRLVAEKLTKEKLSERIIGDVGGIFLPRVPKDRVIEGINERWTGVRLEHMVRCARAAARTSSRVGVIICAIGKAKAPVVLECVRAGLVNELIIDQDLAQALIQAT